ncbi:hypothetical protein [Bombella pollinis]|uniref:SRP54-type proteins GTP-binding domain-containing protein n=1 Tax=Bombella pollinis TaxID=2967337 RepID=A0ABT3WLL4_9PROT|nr:hypothetical protein [Bombella pollinis]MCX5619975.1 hypothetical protein [Bombella pollinis]
MTRSSTDQHTTQPVETGDVVLPSNALSVPEILAWHSIPQELITAMAGSSLAEGLERVIHFAPLPLTPGIPLALGGASGSGKSLTLAKLAARYARQARQSKGKLRQPLVLACDSTPGSYIKLASILRGCDLELVKAYGGMDPEEIDGQDRIILVDLPGLCVYSPTAMTEMREVIDRTKARLSLVVPAGMDPEESTDIAAAFHHCGADSLIASRMEQAGRIGSIITAAACGLSLTYGSYSGSINEGFTQLTPAILARRLLVLPG